MSDRSVLRPESAQLEWHICNSSQKQAIQKMVSFLVEAVQELDDTEKSRHSSRQEFIHPFYQTSLRNRTCLLEGERGSGKTSVLKTLYRMTISERSRRECFGKASAVSNSESNEPVQLLQDLKFLEERLMWLDPIDMEVLPGPSNLFAAILTRIEEVLEPKVGSAEYEVYPGILCRSQGNANALVQLRQLMQDVTLAWDGNMPQRGEHLDPDSYAVEVIRAERARVRIPERLGEILSSLRIRDKNPMFILPIDDCDMSPTRCIELLRLLRMLNIPELFTIVLGKLSSTVDVLHLKLTGDLAKVANVRLGSEAIERPIHKEHHRLAIDVLRKLMPPGQRVSLRNMRIQESMSYRPWGNSTALSDLLTGTRLRSALRFPSMKGNGPTISLSQLLFFGSEPSSLRITSAGILKAPPRRIADLWQSLNSIRANASANLLPNNVSNVELADAEMSGAKPDVETSAANVNADEVIRVFVELYLEAVRTLRDGETIDPFQHLFESHEDEHGTTWSISTGAKAQFETRLEDSRVVKFHYGLEDSSPGLQISHEIHVDGDWVLVPRQVAEHARESQQIIREFMPYVAICNDLIMVSAHTNVRQESLAPSVTRATSTVWTYRDQKATFVWPSPTFTTFVELDAFLERIRLHLRDLDWGDMSKGLSRQHALTLIWLDQWHETLGAGSDILKTEVLTTSGTVFRANMKPWLTSRQMALLAPEYIADSEELLEKLFYNDSIRDYCLVNVKSIRQERIMSIAQAVNTTPNPLLSMLLPASVRKEISQEFEDKARALVKSFHLPVPTARKKALSRKEQLGRDAHAFVNLSKNSDWKDLGRQLQLLESIRSELWGEELEDPLFLSDDLNSLIAQAHELAIDQYSAFEADRIKPKSDSLPRRTNPKVPLSAVQKRIKAVQEYFNELNCISRRDLVAAGANREKLFFTTDTQ